MLTLKPSNMKDAASYNTQLGLAYLDQGDRSRAKRKLLLALTQAPQSASVNAAMAYFLEQAGDMVEAEGYYHKAMALAPGAGGQLNNYGAFLCRRGQYQQAEVYFMKAVKDIQYDHTAGAYENAGLCAMASPDPSKATDFFIKALEQDPLRKASLVELVKIETKKSHEDNALAYLQKYPTLALHDADLLLLSVELAKKTGQVALQTEYKRQLDQLGVKNEYNIDNG